MALKPTSSSLSAMMALARSSLALAILLAAVPRTTLDKVLREESMVVQTDNGFQPSTDQGVDDFKFDTVEKLQSNLFAVSDYYEDGARRRSVR